MRYNHSAARKTCLTIAALFLAVVLISSAHVPCVSADLSTEVSPTYVDPSEIRAELIPLKTHKTVHLTFVELSAKEDPIVAEQIELIEEKPPAVEYTEDDLDLFARLLTAEMGASWVSDEMQLYVGSVVLNRMNHKYFPDTLYDVIYDEGQYSPTWTGAINNTPDERTIANARKLLEEGSILPENVVFQAGFPQGDGVYYEYYDEVLKTTTYFCYISN